MKRIDFKGVQGNRNYIVCHKYLKGESSDAIAEYLIENKLWEGKLESVARLCRDIIYKHRNLLVIDEEYEKIKDVLRIEREIDPRGLGKKDKIDLIKAKHEVIHGGKPLIDQSTHNHKTFIYLDKRAVEENVASNRIVSELPAK